MNCLSTCHTSQGDAVNAPPRLTPDQQLWLDDQIKRTEELYGYPMFPLADRLLALEARYGKVAA
ncbi:MAG TPA: hypothetical protein ENI17_05995 [Pseudomonas xinjiangensis]|uniref:Uncharacterized protein n=2 Tax=root TaxID=1 RepID=A0A7V1FRD6_9GAMM|nr:hypothetical protein [Halopseudomonas xinjiangensis]HEC47164.1 hypothetical protein [Halopseudomonas xinjiangensis]